MRRWKKPSLSDNISSVSPISQVKRMIVLSGIAIFMTFESMGIGLKMMEKMWGSSSILVLTTPEDTSLQNWNSTMVQWNFIFWLCRVTRLGLKRKLYGQPRSSQPTHLSQFDTVELYYPCHSHISTTIWHHPSGFCQRESTVFIVNITDGHWPGIS